MGCEELFGNRHRCAPVAFLGSPHQAGVTRRMVGPPFATIRIVANRLTGQSCTRTIALAFEGKATSPSSSWPRTPPFQGGDTGSNPVGDANSPRQFSLPADRSPQQLAKAAHQTGTWPYYLYRAPPPPLQRIRLSAHSATACPGGVSIAENRERQHPVPRFAVKTPAATDCRNRPSARVC